MKLKAAISCLAFILIFCWISVSLASDNGSQSSLVEQANWEKTQGVVAVADRTPTLSPTADEQIKWQVIGAGGRRGTSPNFVLFGTAGQTAVGKGTSANFQINQGFWQNFAPSFVCGDANANGIVNIADVVYLIQYIFAGGPPPNPQPSGDVNCNGIVNIADVVYLIQYIFSGGPVPCEVCK